MPLRLPAAVAVDQLCQIGRLLGVSCDKLVLQELFGSWPLCRHVGMTEAAKRSTLSDGWDQLSSSNMLREASVMSPPTHYLDLTRM